MKAARTILMLLVFAGGATESVAETPTKMIDNVAALSEAAATLQACFDSPAYKMLDDDKALRLSRLDTRITTLVERIASHYRDKGLYLAYEGMRVRGASSARIRRYVKNKYDYCGPGLYRDMQIYVSDVEGPVSGYLDRISGSLSKDTWPKAAKSAYIARCTRSLRGQGMTNRQAARFCRCMTSGMEAEFGMAEYREMMNAQPDPSGSEHDRRLYGIVENCKSNSTR